ncbi:hypothetical protein Tco_1411075 [Tanacetum coccineum]
MDTTKAQQKALDDDLVAPKNHLKIGKCNQRLSPTLKSNEPTIQVALDALKLTPFYNAFDVSANMNGKIHTVNVDNFKDMLKIYPKLLGQQFKDPPFEEEILSFIRDLGHIGEIKVLSDINVNHLHQPWRSFVAIINKCLSGKTTDLESLCLSRAQILWVMYHNKNVDYVYLLWEDLVYQVENKNSKKNNDMYYPRFTKNIVDYFMAKDQAIPRRNEMFWHYARDDLMFTIIRVISKHQDTQTSAKRVKPAKKKQSATKSKGLMVLSDVALTEAEQMKITLERSKTQQHSFHESGSGADEGTGVTPGVPDVPSYDSEAEQISWKSNDEEDDDEVNIGDDNDDDADNQDDDGQEYDEQDDDIQDDDDQEHDEQDDEEQDDVNEQTDSNNDGDEFVHPKLSTHDEEDKDEEDSDPRVHTPSTNDEESDEKNTRDVNVNLEGRDTEMTNVPCIIVQTTQVIEDTHVVITPINPEAQQQSSSVSSGFVYNMLNPSPDTGIDSIFNLNSESTSLIDVLVTTIAEPPLLLQQLFLHHPILSSHIFKAQVSKILLKIEKTVNEQLEAEVLTRSSNESKTSHAVAANLSELELKKILIDKMESNKLIHRSHEQNNLYKAFIDAYKSDKLILDRYGETILFKRRRDEEDKDEEPFARSNRGSKRRRARKEPESTSAPKEKTSKTTGKSTKGSKSHHKSHQAEEPMQIAKDLEEPAH